MNREEAKTVMSKLIDVFRKEYPNGGAFAAIHATGGHNLINKIYDAHEVELKAKDKRISELEVMVEKMKCCENCKSYINIGSNCLLDMEDRLTCKANNLSKWQLKDNR